MSESSSVGQAGAAVQAGPSVSATGHGHIDGAVVDLLGVLAYAELIAFERLADDARLAPTLADKAALAAMAVAEFGHYRRLEEYLAEAGVDPAEAMRPFVAPLDAFHDSTAPASWLEGLVKAYVGDAIASDFYREISAFVDDATRQLVLSVLGDTGHADFAVARVRAAIGRDPALAGRLALWARRIVGEALAQARRIAGERESLSQLVTGALGGTDSSHLGQLLIRLTEAHAQRMAAMGLSA